MPGLTIPQHLIVISVLLLALFIKLYLIRYLWKLWWKKDDGIANAPTGGIPRASESATRIDDTLQQ